METYIKYAAVGKQLQKAKKFGLKWDYMKKAWYTDDIEKYLELKTKDNQRIMKNTRKNLKKY